jgi:hypothetical protein
MGVLVRTFGLLRRQFRNDVMLLVDSVDNAIEAPNIILWSNSSTTKWGSDVHIPFFRGRKYKLDDVLPVVRSSA